jgi:hypothetical protein
VLAATLLICSGASATAPEPVVDGNRIVDSLTSKVFVPHGVDFPGFEYACQQGWAYGEAGTEPDEVGSTVAAMAAWKINTVRLPLNEDCWLGKHGLPSGSLTAAGYRQAVENFVSGLNQAGIVAIVDLHWSNPDGVIGDGLRPMPDQSSPAFWSSVATTFRDDRSVVFVLFNEPHSRWKPDGDRVFGLSWACWANGGCKAPAEPDTAARSGLSWYTATGMKKLTATVRATGATQPIILSGIDYANDLRGWLANAPDDDQLIAGFHNYPGQRCQTTSCWNEEIAPLNRKVPVLAAEFGQNDCGFPGHVNRFMDWADGERIGYLAWAWWALAEGCGNFALVSNLDGTPLAPVGKALHDHLLTLPEELPLPPDPDPPKLAIRKARWNGRMLQLRVVISAGATRPVRAKIRLVRDRHQRRRPRTAVRLIRRQIKVSSGVATTRARIPRGLKPTLVTVTYPGDGLLTAKTVRRKPSSVSKVTRHDRRG